MIQDIKDAFHPEWKDVLPEDLDKILIFHDKNIYLINEDLPYYKDVVVTKCIYAFAIGQQRYFISLEDGMSDGISKEIFRSMKNRNDAFAIATGYHLYLWYKDKRYCPSCGKPISYGNDERKLICSCGYIEYPRIAPAVIVGILYKNSIVMTKYRVGYPNYALVAGYCEIGETFEDTVRREVMEEVGLKVENIRYYKSQPWGMSGSILAGFYCDAKDTSIKMDAFELKEARFFTPEEIDLEEDNTSLTREMILCFKNGSVR